MVVAGHIDRIVQKFYDIVVNTRPSSFEVVPIVGSDPLYYQINVSRTLRPALLRAISYGPNDNFLAGASSDVMALPSNVVKGVILSKELEDLGFVLGVVTSGGGNPVADERLHVAYEEICKVLGWQHDGGGSGTITS